MEGAPAHGDVSHLLPTTYKRMVAAWLEEDTPSFDYGGFVVGEGPAEAKLLGKSKGIVAGVPFFDEVFKQLDCTVEWHVREGEAFSPVAHCATVRGPVRKILLGERVALNLLARCSGIATKSAFLLHLLRDAGYRNTLAGTRKTTPGFRLVEKYGMLVGGVDAHRVDLSQMTMLKDNHIWACAGDIRRAVAAAKSAGGFAVKVEVECTSEAEARVAIEAGADVVMLDNFEPGEVQSAALRLKEGWHVAWAGAGGEEEAGRVQQDERAANGCSARRQRREFLIEVSGGLTEANVAQFACAHVDVISSSSLHQGVKHVDFSLKVVPKDAQAQRARVDGPEETAGARTGDSNVDGGGTVESGGATV